MSSPLDAEIQIVLREIHGEVQLLEQSGEYGEQFKNARRLLATGFFDFIFLILLLKTFRSNKT